MMIVSIDVNGSRVNNYSCSPVANIRTVGKFVRQRGRQRGLPRGLSKKKSVFCATLELCRSILKYRFWNGRRMAVRDITVITLNICMKFSFLTVHRLTGFWKKKKEESIAVVQCPSTLIRPNFNLLPKIFAGKMMRLSTGAK